MINVSIFFGNGKKMLKQLCKSLKAITYGKRTKEKYSKLNETQYFAYFLK